MTDPFDRLAQYRTLSATSRALAFDGPLRSNYFHRSRHRRAHDTTQHVLYLRPAVVAVARLAPQPAGHAEQDALAPVRRLPATAQPEQPVPAAGRPPAGLRPAAQLQRAPQQHRPRGLWLRYGCSAGLEHERLCPERPWVARRSCWPTHEVADARRRTECVACRTLHIPRAFNTILTQCRAGWSRRRRSLRVCLALPSPV